jgi:hypothetical protein
MGLEHLAIDHGYQVLIDGTVLDPHGRVLPQCALGAYAGVYVPEEKMTFYVHRLVAHVHVHNPRPDIFKCVDHIDRGKNNHASNLRWLTHQLNTLNNDAKGCSYNKRFKKWRAYLCQKTLGWFKTEEEASAVAKKARYELFLTTYTNLVTVKCAKTHGTSSTYFAESLRSPMFAC